MATKVVQMFGSVWLVNLTSLALFKTGSVNVDRSLKSILRGVRCDDVTCKCVWCILTFHVHIIRILTYLNTYNIFIGSLHWCMCVCVCVCVCVWVVAA